MNSSFPSLQIQPRSRVDFAYAFAPPHRLTVCLPGSGDKTLLDLEPGKLTMSWSYEKLADLPFYVLKTPHVDWKVAITPRISGHIFPRSSWRRLEGSLPVLENVYEDYRGRVQLEVSGGARAAIVRITVTNLGEQVYEFDLFCEVLSGWVLHNHAWIDADRNPDTLVAMFFDRADRVLVLGLGADAVQIGKKSFTLVWKLQPGETRTGWLIRPYEAYEADLPELRLFNWENEMIQAYVAWRVLLDRAVQIQIPDPGVKDAYYACLADMFVMREPLGKGYVGSVPGTELYRAASPFEGSLASIVLDQAGLHPEAAEGQRIYLEMQESSGEWADDKGWAHHMWGASGFKAWATMEHYRLAGDLEFLASVYPRMLASARWQNDQRNLTRVLESGQRPPTYGLMPRGMGDAGLMDDDDYIGVFYPHNIMAVFADRLAVEAAEILGRMDDLPELRNIYQAGLADLLASLEKGAIQEEGYRWIPGTPNKTSGSRWGVLYALAPCGLLPPDHELVDGTLRYIESHKSQGGHPIHTGWMPDGSWVAISLDNFAAAHLARGNGDAAAEYLYATLNHATPLYTWCEERGVEPGTNKISGDRQHLFTPVAVARYLRDALVWEKDGGLHLALGTARGWLSSGEPVGISHAPTHFGPVSYELRYDASESRVAGEAIFSEGSGPAWVNLYLRLAGGLRVQSVEASTSAKVLPGREGICWETPRGKITFTCKLE